jgi:T5orf172 domain
MPAYVYLLEEVPFAPNEASQLTKIGCSGNPPEWRVGANLTRGNPRHLRLPVIYQFETEKAAYEAEDQAHRHFHEFYERKEWFRRSWQEVAAWCDAQGWAKSQIWTTPEKVL